MLNFIHVGDFKTGTTWLQRYGFSHPEIYYLGDYFENREYHKLFHELIDARDLDFNADSLREQFHNQIINETIPPRALVGVSREVLSQSNFITGEHARRNAERIRAVFGKLKIIYIIREQFSLLNSIYSQYVKMGGTLHYEDFVFDPIQSKGLINRLKYHHNIAMYLELFGEKNVFVGLFEQFINDKKTFLSDIYKFIGCQNTDYLPFAETNKVNPSLTTVGCLVQRFFNHFIRTPYNPSRKFLPLDKIASLFLSQDKGNKLNSLTEQCVVPNFGSLDRDARINFGLNMALIQKIERFSTKIKLGNPIKLHNKTKQLLKKEFIDSNNILSKKYKLEIDKYGWNT